MKETIRNAFNDSIDAIRQTQEHLSDRIAQAVEIIVGCYESGGGLLLFVNGGSAADAQHITCELVGRF